MDAKEIWERACDRVGLEMCGQCETPVREHEIDCSHLPNTPYFPPIGDTDAMVAMLEWLYRSGPKYRRNIVRINQCTEGVYVELYNAGSDPELGKQIIVGTANSTLSLALAAAVCALKE